MCCWLLHKAVGHHPPSQPLGMQSHLLQGHRMQLTRLSQGHHVWCPLQSDHACDREDGDRTHRRLLQGNCIYVRHLISKVSGVRTTRCNTTVFPTTERTNTVQPKQSVQLPHLPKLQSLSYTQWQEQRSPHSLDACRTDTAKTTTTSARFTCTTIWPQVVVKMEYKGYSVQFIPSTSFQRNMFG